MIKNQNDGFEEKGDLSEEANKLYVESREN